MNYGATTLGPLSTDPEADIKTVEEFWKKKGFTTKVEHSTNPKETQIRLTAPVGYDNAGQSQELVHAGAAGAQCPLGPVILKFGGFARLPQRAVGGSPRARES